MLMKGDAFLNGHDMVGVEKTWSDAAREAAAVARRHGYKGHTISDEAGYASFRHDDGDEVHVHGTGGWKGNRGRVQGQGHRSLNDFLAQRAESRAVFRSVEDAGGRVGKMMGETDGPMGFRPVLPEALPPEPMMAETMRQTEGCFTPDAPGKAEVYQPDSAR